MGEKIIDFLNAMQRVAGKKSKGRGKSKATQFHTPMDPSKVMFDSLNISFKKNQSAAPKLKASFQEAVY